ARALRGRSPRGGAAVGPAGGAYRPAQAGVHELLVPALPGALDRPDPDPGLARALPPDAGLQPGGVLAETQPAGAHPAVERSGQRRDVTPAPAQQEPAASSLPVR